MKRLALSGGFLVSVLLSTVFVFSAAVAAVSPATSPGAYAPHRLIVKLKPALPATDRDAVRAVLSARVRAQLSGIDAEVWDVGALDVAEAVERLAHDPRVEFVEPDYLVRASAVFPTDPQFPKQWSLYNAGQPAGKVDADIDAPEAWTTDPGAPVLIGVIDTGIDFEHEDLKGTIFTNTREIPGNGVDDDGNGYVDDVRGWDFVNGDDDPADDNGHGTHVSGIIAAPGNNGIGMAGVCWSARILPLKFLDATGVGSTSDAILALQYAVRMGVRIVNLSWGGFIYSTALRAALADAGRHGVLCVAASGNDGLDASLYPAYPAAYPLDNMVSVASSDRNDALSPFSDYGSNVDLAAPGSDIVSAFPGNRYVRLSGTSMSSAVVSGAACLLWSRAPFMTAAGMKAALLRSVDRLPALDGRLRTGGRLNLERLVSTVDAVPPGAVTTLAVDATASNAVGLAWTASGDDGATGTASQYELRYATTPISAGNFATAKLAAAAPAPLLEGSAQACEVTGLFFGTTYYFALEVIDEAGNRSAISNVVSATTLGVPVVDAAPDAFSATLFTGGKSTKTLTVTNHGAGTLDFSVPVAPAWVRLDPAAGRIGAGQSRSVQVIFDAAQLAGGHYDSAVIIASNDPNTANVPLAVALQVNDAPNIAINTTTLDCGPGLTGACAQHDLVLTNTGTAVLNVGSVSVSELPFAVASVPFILGPGESKPLSVFFCPQSTGKATGTLSIPSNDPDRPVVTVALLGRGVAPPKASAAPSSIAVDLYSGGTATRTVTLSNAGGSDLVYTVSVPAPGSTVEVSGASSASAGVIATARPVARDALEKMKNAPAPQQVSIRGAAVDRDARTSSPSASAPSSALAGGNHFAETFGSAANPYFGSELMRGNVFKCTTTTNLKEYRFYLNPIVPTEMWFVVYENDSESGLYVLVGASNLTPSPAGEGWYSSGDINVHMLRNHYYLMAATFVDDAGYFNQRNITPYPIPASFGSLVGGAGWSWAPFVTFPPSGYQGVPPEAFGDPVAYYQAVVTDGVVPWLSVSPETGRVHPGGTTTLRVDIDTAGLAPGDHDAVVRITGNDPLAPTIDVPVHVHVNAAADIALPSGPVDFGECFTGTANVDTLLVTNRGSQFLSVSHLASDNAAFTVTPASLFLGNGQFAPVIVTFRPKSDGAHTATLTLTSDDPDEAVSTVWLRGTGRRPPHIAVSSAALSEVVRPGRSRTRTLSIVNAGESALSFDLSPEKPGPLGPTGGKINPGIENPRAVSRHGGATSTNHASPSYSGHRADGPAAWRAVARDPQTTSARGLKVLALYTGVASEILDALTFYPDIARIDGFDAEFDTPSLTDLAPYDAVLMINDFVFADAKALGNALADYVDGGGSVIVTLAAFIQGYDVRGRFASGGYLPFEIGTGPAGSAILGDFDAQHPIMAGVGFVVGDLLGTTTLTPGARLVASWDDGRPLVATAKRGRVVGMNVYLGDGGYWAGDIPLMIDNALEWTTGVRWLRLSPPDGVVGPQQHRDVTVTFDSNDLPPGLYSAVLRVSHNDPAAHAVEIPVTFTVDSTVTVTGVEDAPARYALEANHPNPFNPATTIAYDLAGAGRSRLVVYDVGGARIRELVNASQRPGHYTVTWDGRNDHGVPVASGVYFYRLTSGPFSATRKMVLLK